MSKLIVFMLEHVHEFEDGRDDTKFIGLFSTRERAQAALALIEDKPGFRDRPYGFAIWECEVDSEAVGWPEGYVTVRSDGTISE